MSAHGLGRCLCPRRSGDTARWDRTGRRPRGPEWGGQSPNPMHEAPGSQSSVSIGGSPPAPSWGGAVTKVPLLWTVAIRPRARNSLVLRRTVMYAMPYVRKLAFGGHSGAGCEFAGGDPRHDVVSERHVDELRPLRIKLRGSEELVRTAGGRRFRGRVGRRPSRVRPGALRRA